MTSALTMTGRKRFLAALRGEAPDVRPVWFMRQAGRCLPDYRELRKRHSFMDLARTPELAARATLMPVDMLGVDGAVIFADIMLPLEGMGVDFEIRPGVGPVIEHPIRTAADVAALRDVDTAQATAYVYETVRQVRAALGERAAVLGFAGAPFTLACYLIDGKPTREYPAAKTLMRAEPTVWHALMTKLTTVTIAYLQEQIRAGADVVQLFDSWLGLLDAETYREFVQPYTAQIFERLRDLAPSIHFSTGTGQLLTAIAEAGPDVISVDWRLPIADVRATVGPNVGLQGNLDPTLLLAPWDVVERAAGRILDEAAGLNTYIFNLGHGILPETDPEQLRRLVSYVHRAVTD